MRDVQEQSALGKPSVSALRQCLKRPQTWLAIFGMVALLALADSFRSPADQATGRLYVQAVRVYQAWGRPLLKGRVRCRYCPSCSEYSIQAVQTHGIRYGLVLSWNRVFTCRTTVPLRTYDPVPLAEQ